LGVVTIEDRTPSISKKLPGVVECILLNLWNLTDVVIGGLILSPSLSMSNTDEHDANENLEEKVSTIRSHEKLSLMIILSFRGLLLGAHANTVVDMMKSVSYSLSQILFNRPLCCSE
jgi:hypothetical protein